MEHTLNIMPEIKLISGDKAGQKVFNRFLATDKKSKFRESINSLKNGFFIGSQRFKLKMPINQPYGLNPQQEFALQELYLKWKAVGNEIVGLKDRRFYVAEQEGKILHYSKLLTLDFRKRK